MGWERDFIISIKGLQKEGSAKKKKRGTFFVVRPLGAGAGKKKMKCVRLKEKYRAPAPEYVFRGRNI